VPSSGGSLSAGPPSGPVTVTPLAGFGAGPDYHSGAATGADSRAKRGRGKLVGVLAAVVVLAVVAVVLVFALKGSDEATAAQPTRESLREALLTIRDVRDRYDSTWNAIENIGSGDPFCPQFALAEPDRQADVLFHSVDDSADAYLFENVSTFKTDEDVTRFYDQERAISENCYTSDGRLGNDPITDKVSSITKDLDSVGYDAIGVKYETTYKDYPELGVVITGYVIEARMDRIVVSTNYFVYGREPTKAEVDKFYAITKAAIDKASGSL
jgi:hypothetical protein